MRKWLRRLVLGFLVLVAGLLIAAGICYHYAREVPSYYRFYKWDSRQRSIVNQQAVDKMTRAQNLAARSHAMERAAATSPQTRAVQAPLTLTFTQEEVNAFFEQNIEAAPEMKAKLGQYVVDPGIYFEEDRVILAAQVKEMGHAVVSLHFEPRIDPSGDLQFRLAETTMGRLPLPQSKVQEHVAHLLEPIKLRLASWQQMARMDEAGGSNSEAVAAAGARLLLGALTNRSVPAVVFLPVNEKGTAAPLRITDIQVEREQMTISLRPMSRKERQAALEEIRRPWDDVEP